MPPRDSSHRPVGQRRPGAHPPSAARAKRKNSAAPIANRPVSDHVDGPLSEAVAAFLATQPFPLDPFQLEAARTPGGGPLGAGGRSNRGWENGRGGICHLAGAPRGATRDLYRADESALQSEVPRFAPALRRGGGRAADRRYRRESAAPIVVMTTEIYRNMLLEGARAARMSRARRGQRPACPARGATRPRRARAERRRMSRSWRAAPP